MLERLEQLVANDPNVTNALATGSNISLMHAMERALLAHPEVFAEAVAQLTSDDVQGCAPEQGRAEAARAHGNALFQEGQYGAAIESYTEALQYQSALTPSGRLAISRIFSNRAAALSRLLSSSSAAPISSAPSSSSTPLGSISTSASSYQRSTSSTTGSWSQITPQSKGAVARAALVDSCCAAQADPTFAKAYYRAACARRALGDLAGAIAECRRALEVASGAGGGAGGGGRSASDRGAGMEQTGSGRGGGGGGRGSTTRHAGGGGSSTATPAIQLDEAATLLAELHLELDEGGIRRKREEAAEAQEPVTMQAIGGGSNGGSSGGVAAVREGDEGAAGQQDFGPINATDQRVIEGFSPELGRHLVVSPDSPALPPAKDVLYDWPLAAVLCKRWRRRGGGGGGGGASPSTVLRCWRCTAALRTDEGAVAYPCSYCPMALYCSPYCRDHDLFHVPGGCECGFPWSHVLPDEALLACRLARRAAAEALEATEGQPATEPAREAAAAGGSATPAPTAYGLPPAGPLGLASEASPAVSYVWSSSSAGEIGDPHLTHGSQLAKEVLEKLLSHCDSQDSVPLLRTALLAAITAATYRAACHMALQRWQKQRLKPWDEDLYSGLDVRQVAPTAAPLRPPPWPLQQQQQQQQQIHDREHRHRLLQRFRQLSGAVPIAGLRPPELTAEAVFLALCRVRVNGMAVRPDSIASSYDRLALALYPRAVLLNHSCVPNLGLRFCGLQLVVRTCRTVAPGQPLTISYGPQRGKAPRSERLAMLKTQYAFTCTCEACSAATTDPWVKDDAAVLDAALWGLKCPSCSDQPVRREFDVLVSDAEASGAGVHSKWKLPAAVLPTDPRVRALCGSTTSFEDTLDTSTMEGSGVSSSKSVSECTRCGRHMSAAAMAAAVKTLAAAAALVEQASAALGEDDDLTGDGPSPIKPAAPPTPSAVVSLLAAWRKLQCAVVQRRQVLPDTNRLTGSTLHQLASLAIKVLRVAAAANMTSAGSAGGAQRPSKDDLTALAHDAVRYVSYSLLALQRVYGTCSTEVLYELELLIELLCAVAPSPSPPPPPQLQQSSSTAAAAATAAKQQRRPATPFHDDHCPSCGLAGSLHEAALTSRLSGFLATALEWSHRNKGPDSNISLQRDPPQPHIAASLAGALPPATATAADAGGGGCGNAGPGDLAAGNDDEKRLHPIWNAAQALHICLRWHLLGLSPSLR